MTGPSPQPEPPSRGRKRLLAAALVLAALGALWLALPHGAGCHILGGALHATEGPGKPTVCMIPWDRH
jgi:hypothetical protein